MAVVTIGVRRESTARGSGKVWARPGESATGGGFGWRRSKARRGPIANNFSDEGGGVSVAVWVGMKPGGSSSSGRKVVDVGDVVGG